MNMISTGWKQASNIKQDSRYKKVNGGKCYNFSNLKSILNTSTTDHAYIPTTGGVKDTRASPVLYTYNYNFNIPKNAEINYIDIRIVADVGVGKTEDIKTNTLKLKLGTSTTDNGNGNNIADTIKWVQKPKWTTITLGTKTQASKLYGINISPEIINNSNFGCVYQCIGLSSTWEQPRIASIEMNIYYTPSTTITSIPKAEFDLNITIPNSQLDITNPNTPIPITLNYLHKQGNNGKYNGGDTPNTVIKSDNLLISETRQKTYTVPSIQTVTTDTTDTYTKIINIYPDTLTGTQTLTVTINNTTTTYNIPVINSNGYTIPNTDQDKLTDGSQRCIISNNNFIQCNDKNNNAYNITGDKQYTTQANNTLTTKTTPTIQIQNIKTSTTKTTKIQAKLTDTYTNPITDKEIQIYNNTTLITTQKTNTNGTITIIYNTTQKGTYNITLKTDTDTLYNKTTKTIQITIN